MSSVTVQSAIGAGVVTLAGLITAYWFYARDKKRRSSKPPTQWREVAKLTKIHLYPLKSGRRIELNVANVQRYGLVQSKKDEQSLQLHDRSFLVCGDNGEFKTARTYPKMVLIEVAVHDENHVSFDAPGMRQLYVKIPKAGEATEKNITLHEKEVSVGLDCGDEAAAWFSRYIYGKETGLHLVFHDASEKNKRDITKVHKSMIKTYNDLPDSTGLYSDLTAVLMLNQASVDDLNTKIESDTVITPEHFRPNLIIEGDGAPPYVEDYWTWIKIGDTIFKNVKPCTRCMFTTINPETGIRNTNREPLKTMESYRKVKDILKTDFEAELTVMGFNVAVIQEGEVNINDKVYVGM